MNCLDFVDRLAALLAGSCSREERDEAEDHAASCADCAELLRAARSRPGGPLREEQDETDAPDDLVASVLARTSGSACSRAERLLCDYVDDELAADDRHLVSAHLEHCAPCARLADALREATALLPALAELDPGPGFFGGVLSATSRAAVPAPTVWGRLASLWERGLARPRFALEVAYAATLVLLIVVGNPAARLHAASARTIDAASAGIERAKSDYVPAIAERVASSPLLQVAGRAVAGLGSASTTVGLPADFWSRAGQRLASAWSWLRGATSWLIDAAADSWSQLRAAASKWLASLTEPGRGPARSRDQKVAGLRGSNPGGQFAKS